MKHTGHIILAVVLFSTMLSPAFSDVFTNKVSDPSTDLIKRLLVEVHRPLSEITKLSYQIKKAEDEYGINPILLIAVMEEELKYMEKGFAEAHVFVYNLDNGIIIPHNKVDSLPSPYSDVERVSRALANQIETFNGDLETSVAAYFFGPTLMKRHGVEELDEDGKAILQSVIDFIRDHPDDRANGAPITTTGELKIAKRDKPGSRAGFTRFPGSSALNKEFSSIEE